MGVSVSDSTLAGVKREALAAISAGHPLSPIMKAHAPLIGCTAAHLYRLLSADLAAARERVGRPRKERNDVGVCKTAAPYPTKEQCLWMIKKSAASAVRVRFSQASKRTLSAKLVVRMARANAAEFPDGYRPFCGRPAPDATHRDGLWWRDEARAYNQFLRETGYPVRLMQRQTPTNRHKCEVAWLDIYYDQTVLGMRVGDKQDDPLEWPDPLANKNRPENVNPNRMIVAHLFVDAATGWRRTVISVGMNSAQVINACVEFLYTEHLIPKRFHLDRHPAHNLPVIEGLERLGVVVIQTKSKPDPRVHSFVEARMNSINNEDLAGAFPGQRRYASIAECQAWFTEGDAIDNSSVFPRTGEVPQDAIVARLHPRVKRVPDDRDRLTSVFRGEFNRKVDGDLRFSLKGVGEIELDASLEPFARMAGKEVAVYKHPLQPDTVAILWEGVEYLVPVKHPGEGGKRAASDFEKSVQKLAAGQQKYSILGVPSPGPQSLPAVKAADMEVIAPNPAPQTQVYTLLQAIALMQAERLAAKELTARQADIIESFMEAAHEHIHADQLDAIRAALRSATTAKVA